MHAPGQIGLVRSQSLRAANTVCEGTAELQAGGVNPMVASSLTNCCSLGVKAGLACVSTCEKR